MNISEMRLGSRQPGEMSEFKYLGSVVSTDSCMDGRLKHRLGEGARIMEGLVTIWRSREMTTDARMGILESIEVPTVMYGSES